MELAILAGDKAEARDLYGRAERQLAACADPGILHGRFSLAKPNGDRRSRARPAADDLSAREMAVLRLMPTQRSLREIGHEMYVTVKTHARNIYAKLRVGSRSGAVARARELHLL